MIPLRPDIFAVNGSREEVTLDFGTVSALSPDPGGLKATLDARIILSPAIARQVALLLANNVRKYEAEFGELTEEPAQAADPKVVSDLLYDPVPGVSSDGNARLAAFLFGAVEALGIPFAYERSFKMAGATLLPNRFLCGVKRRMLGEGADGILSDLCRRLEMPPAFLERFTDEVGRADYVHFGYEEGVSGCLFKVYLEFDVGLKAGHPDLRKMPAAPFELHVAFKWSPSDGSVRAVSRYTGFPFMDRDAMRARIAALCADPRNGETLAFADRVLELAYGRLPRHGFFYMEVREEDTPRASFDVKVYEAGIPMREILVLADAFRRRHGIPDERFLPLCGRIGDATFGHVTGGIDRGGTPFLTLYYGVAWR